MEKPKPVNKKLYSKVLKKIKAKEKVWPSAYASGRVVREYKRLGGKYSNFGKEETNFGKELNNFGKKIISGLEAIARARDARFCIPPESSEGKRSAVFSLRPTAFNF